MQAIIDQWQAARSQEQPMFSGDRSDSPTPTMAEHVARMARADRAWAMQRRVEAWDNQIVAGCQYDGWSLARWERVLTRLRAASRVLFERGISL
jgi:hypothetical protein